MHRGLLLSLLALTLLSAAATAQTCEGLPSYSTGAVQALAQGSLNQQVNTMSAGLAYGFPSSVFGRATVGTSSSESIDGSTLEVGGRAGYQIQLGGVHRSQLCPVADFTLAMGPRDPFGSGVERSGQAASIGLAFGTLLVTGPRTVIVPSGELAYVYARKKAEDAGGYSLFEISERYVRARVGVGILVSPRFSIRPIADFPLGNEVGQPTFGLTLAYNFGPISGSLVP